MAFEIFDWRESCFIFCSEEIRQETSFFNRDTKFHVFGGISNFNWFLEIVFFSTVFKETWMFKLISRCFKRYFDGKGFVLIFLVRNWINSNRWKDLFLFLLNFQFLFCFRQVRNNWAFICVIFFWLRILNFGLFKELLVTISIKLCFLQDLNSYEFVVINVLISIADVQIMLFCQWPQLQVNKFSQRFNVNDLPSLLTFEMD
jgi:hypothetical protein